jgi:thiol-disulfide isomerase/thioredoxin
MTDLLITVTRQIFRLWLAIVVGLQIGGAQQAIAAEDIVVTVSEDVEVGITRFPAQGDYLLLWLAPEYGFLKAHRSLASRMPEQGIEVWQSDIVEALFLPQGTASLKQLDGRYVADLIEQAHAISGKKIAIVGDSFAVPAALHGARQWQSRNHGDPYLVGAILFSPYTYAYRPQLGQPPIYLPIVESTNIPMMVYQAQKSGIVSQFRGLIERLGRNDSPVYTQPVAGVMSLFYEEQPSDAMRQAAVPLPTSIRQILPILAQYDFPAQPVPLKLGIPAKSGVDIYLKEFSGNFQPPAFSLNDINGRLVAKTGFSEKLTVINFWASWCPPCVEEIPSLNRLKKKMASKPFELITINYAEDKETVAAFLQKVEVDFPVLLDLDGSTAKQWKVISYPSTFVIDSHGEIRYGVNAAIEWDAPEVIEALEKLLPSNAN